MKIALPGILALFLVTFRSEGQKTVLHNNQQWIQYINQLKFSERLSLFTDASLRRSGEFSRLSQTTFRTGLNYTLAGRLQGLTGIAFFQTYTNNNLSRIEFRPYQDFSYLGPVLKILVHHRLRIESRYFRWVENGEIQPGPDLNFRFRYRILAQIPVWNFGSKNNERKLIFNLGDELMLNAGKEIVYNSVDNNRVLVGTTFQYDERISVSLMYNFQFAVQNQPDSYVSSDILWLVFQHRIVW
jgi:hypothetical protein